MRATLCIDCGRVTPTSPCATCTTKRNQASPYNSTEWRRLRKRVTEGRSCTICASTDRVAAHHVQLRTHGGPDIEENLIPLCHGCHARYHADERTGRTTTLRRLVEG